MSSSPCDEMPRWRRDWISVESPRTPSRIPVRLESSRHARRNETIVITSEFADPEVGSIRPR